MIRKILIANRGEIACRIMRTCRKMGIQTVAVYSDADAKALHVETADEAVYIGGSAPSESYLHINRIIEAAHHTGTDAIHPGYGFLAENAHFARAVAEAGLIFIGPTPEAIEAMGDKREAKLLLKDIPFVPGYTDEDQSNETLTTAARNIGFPIMVKATAGGGGKGMRQVTSSDALLDALEAARREAKQAFGNDMLMLEKVVTNPRHVEIQIFGDTRGKVVALGERECTIQRRHQKIIEESPSTALTPELREKMCAAAVSVGEQIGYINAGTVEFLVDDKQNFYFMEMNTRLQVEHPVTEAVFGIDLVEWQIRVAQGESLDEIDYTNALERGPSGHAIEVRVYSEDPANNFLPVTGDVLLWQPHSGDGLRIEAGIRSGDTISAYYDPMIAKIIASGPTRHDAIRKLDYALNRTLFFGLKNNIAFLRRVVIQPDHLAGRITTAFIADHPEVLSQTEIPPEIALIAAALSRQNSESAFWRNNLNQTIKHTFTINEEAHTIEMLPHRTSGRYDITIGEATYSVQKIAESDSSLTIIINGHRQHIHFLCTEQDVIWVQAKQGTLSLKWVSPLPLPGDRADAAGSLRAPMPGQVIQVMVEAGQTVKQGAVLLIMEAMKMEHRIEAPYDGSIEEIYYQVGDSVQQDEVLLKITASS